MDRHWWPFSQKRYCSIFRTFSLSHFPQRSLSAQLVGSWLDRGVVRAKKTQVKRTLFCQDGEFLVLLDPSRFFPGGGAPLKSHTKCLTHTLRDLEFIHGGNWDWLNATVCRKEAYQRRYGVPGLYSAVAKMVHVNYNAYREVDPGDIMFFMWLSVSQIMFFALLPMWELHWYWSPVDSSHKRPVMLTFDIFFVDGLNRVLNKLSNCRWCEPPRHSCDATNDMIHTILGLNETFEF